MLSFNKYLVPLAIISIVSLILSLPLLKPGLFIMHDDQQVARLFLFDQALKAGQFPVRWVKDLGFGFGYPLFNFYPPFSYAFSEVFNLLGLGFINSIKITFFASIFLSGLSMYLLVKEIYGKREGLISALFYMALPYRAIDVYIRGALAESFSFVLLPLILWSFYKLHNTYQSKYVALSAIFMALLMITHNLIFLPFMVILPVFLLFLAVFSKNITREISLIIVAVILGFVLSAFFWLPSLVEKKFTLVDNLLLTDLANYKLHFVYPQQLWNWPWGFGGSSAGLSDGISFKVGKLHLILSLMALIATIIFIKKKSGAFRHLNHLTIFFAFALFFTAFMTTAYSLPVWLLITPLAYLQFPWRFLMFTGLFSSILAGAFIHNMRLSILKMLFGALVVILLLVTNLKLFKPKDYRLNLTDKEATSKEIISWDVSSTSFEYSPKEFPLKRGALGVNVAAIEKSKIPTQVVSGHGVEITNIINLPHKISFNAKAINPVAITINNFYFPGWETAIDGQKIAIDSSNKYKLISFPISTGNHHIIVDFKNTPARTIGNFLSIFSFAIIVFTLFRWRTQKNNSISN